MAFTRGPTLLLSSTLLPLLEHTPPAVPPLPPGRGSRLASSEASDRRRQALCGQPRYLLAAFLPKASISCLRHSIPSICSWAESSGPRGGKVATRADSDDLLWGMIGGAEPCVRVCLSSCGPLASSPVLGPCGENSVSEDEVADT